MNFQKIIVLVLLCLGTRSCKEKEGDAKKESSPSRPNIVLIMADDQGWGDLRIHGNTNLNTPHIDALAKNGVSFENFFVQPVCSPTRAEVLTGLHFPRIGVYDTSAGGERMDSEVPTLAHILKDVGYATAAYGKWHNGMQPPYHPNAKGFEEYYGFTSGHWGNYFSPLLEHNGKIVKGEGFLVDDLTDHGMAFMAKNKNRPFFLYLPYNTPHSPMQVPDRFWNRFENASLEQTYFGLEEENPLFTKAALAMVENIDYNVGRLMEKLRALHLEENTIVLYMSDNGPNGWRWNGGMRGKKGSVDEGGVRSPFFIQWKDAIASGKKVEQIASALDILPTLTDLAGIPLDKGTFLDGKSLRPLLEQKQPQWEDRLIFNHWNKKTSVRSQRYRLDNQNRLYDMVKDRGQSQDISEDLPEILDSLIRAKNQWLAQFRPKDPSQKDDRPFTLGHPEHTYTQIPARDGIPHGNITRSNKFPNNTFFTQWTSPKDSISWDVDILADGRFEVALYYTASQKAKGTLVELSMGNHSISKKVNQSHDPPLTGMENDRVPRKESYVKDFIPMHLGEIQLEKGRGTLTLKAPEIPNGEAVDVRLLLFKRL